MQESASPPISAPAGAQLILPLRRLDEPVQPAASPARTVDLDAPGAPAVGVWSQAVRAAAEICLLVDAAGRVVAASTAAGAVLGEPVGARIGARLVDLVTVVDFTSGAAPDVELQRAVPPLRALATGGLARGLLRLRIGGDLVTYDVVAVPLTGSAGAVAFFVAV